MEKLTIEQLLELTRDEQEKYLKTLPKAEREPLVIQILRAESDRNVRKLVDNLNSNAKK